jgi:hypothetical protein
MRPYRPIGWSACVAFAAAALAIALPAAGADAADCPYISAAAIAKAVGLAHATAYKVQGPEQPTYATYRFSLCRAVAWSGTPPKDPGQAQAMIANGTAAGFVIKTNEEAQGNTPEQIEHWHEEYEKQTEAFHAGAFALIGHAQAKLFIPKPLGAEGTFGITLKKGPKRGGTAIWYSNERHSYLTMAVTDGKKHPAAQINALAATVVPSFGL